MGKIKWGNLLRGRRAATAAAQEADYDALGPETPLIIKAARVVVTTRVATRVVLERHLSVTDVVADALLARLEHCEVVGPHRPEQSRSVLATPSELPRIVEEFRRRG